MNSGLLKLTCPLLINPIDQLEDDGYSVKFTSQVEAKEEWKESCQTRHPTHAVARKAVLKATSTANDSDSSLSILRQELGEKGAGAFLDSGIAGATVDKPNVKCLHCVDGGLLI